MTCSNGENFEDLARRLALRDPNFGFTQGRNRRQVEAATFLISPPATISETFQIEYLLHTWLHVNNSLTILTDILNNGRINASEDHHDL